MATLYIDGYTMEQIAQKYDLSRERVRQILGKKFIHGVKESRKKIPNFVCEHCGAKKRLVPTLAAMKKFCNKQCYSDHMRSKDLNPDGTPRTRFVYQDREWVWDYDNRRMIPRYRYVAQQMLGRKLERNEWVRLRDNNPNNLSPENIYITTAAEAARQRYIDNPVLRKWTKEKVLEWYRQYMQEHEDFPTAHLVERIPGSPKYFTTLRVLGEKHWPDAMRNLSYVLNVPNSRYRKDG